MFLNSCRNYKKMEALFPRINIMKDYKFAKYDFFDNKVIMKGFNILSNFQKNILLECLEKGSGTLSIPMGTGKTIISILLGLIQSNHKDGNVLIIMSKSLIHNCAEEILKFFGDTLEYDILHKEYIKKIDNWVCKKKITLTTTSVLSSCYSRYNLDFYYIQMIFSDKIGINVKEFQIIESPILPNFTNGIQSIYSKEWSCLIIDECQEYYNSDVVKSKCLCCIYSKNRWLLSGTVLQEPDKLFGYYLLLNDKVLPRNLPEFRLYVKNKKYKGFSDTLVKRNVNEDFIQPKINKIIVSHSLSEEEARIYINVKNIIKNLQVEHEKNKLNNDKEKTKKFSSYMLVMISYLRQCIICPILPIASVAITVSEDETRNELSLIFMNSINSLGLEDWLNDLASIKSSRISSLLEKLENHKNEKVIIFSCYKSFLNVVKSFITERETFTLEGNMKIEERKNVCKRFEESKNGVSLLTYDIGGSGTNLQHCSVVFIADYWWNADKILQAIARILRRGQLAENVYIYFFTSNTGMENGMFRIQKNKLEIVGELLNGSRTTNVEKLSAKNMMKLLNDEDNIDILKKIQNIE